jgi:hypothetical protein
MSSLLVTIIISVVLVLLAVAGLSIGLILTGKPKITRGTCGWNPKKERTEDCGKKIKCPLCKNTDKS